MASAAVKRKIDFVDLTQSSDAEDSVNDSQARKLSHNAHRVSHANQNSHPAYRNASSQKYAAQSQPPYATPPLLSQPSSSQPVLNSSFGQGPNPYNIRTPTGKETYENAKIRNIWMDEEEVRGEIDLTLDDEDDNYDNHELYGILNTKIVGNRFYTGRATVGEYVVVKREPRNPYDSNAVRINNVMDDQIGHPSRQCAAKLAPFMDSKALLVEGALTDPKGMYDCPIGLKPFGTTDPVAGADLKRQMVALRLPVTDHNKAEAERKRKQKEREKALKAAQKANFDSLRKGGSALEFDSDSPRYANINVPGPGEPTQSLEQVLELQRILG